MNVFLSVKQFFADLRRQKLRTAMTMFGIFWGTCSIVLLFAFGNGMTEAQLKSQRGMGENIAIFWGGITSKDFKGLSHELDDQTLALGPLDQTAQSIHGEHCPGFFVSGAINPYPQSTASDFSDDGMFFQGFSALE